LIFVQIFVQLLVEEGMQFNNLFACVSKVKYDTSYVYYCSCI